MSTNDDSASRRGRRADQGEPDWRTPNRQRPGERWDQPGSASRDSGGRDNQAQNAAYSGFTRQSYSQARQDPAPPPPQQGRHEPQQQPQGYYQEPQPRQDLPRSYTEPALPTYSPPPSPYSQDPQHLSYGDAGRDDLFSRDAGPLNYGQNPYGSQAGYHPDNYESTQRGPLVQPATPREPDYYNRAAPSPSEDYERGFGARIAQESGASRFFLPEEQPQAQQWAQKGYAPHSPQAPMERGYDAPQNYPAGGYEPHGGQLESFGRDQYDPRYGGQQGWQGEDHGFHEESGGLPVPQALHGDELDEDFFGDEEDYEDDHAGGRKRGRTKLIAAALAAAVAAGGGAYYYKSMGGGDKATPFIRADNRPSKETPGNPGGRQFPNGEKSIYERLTPDGQTQVSSFTPPPSSTSQAFNSTPDTAAAGGNSLEDRIEEALRRAQRSGDAPAAAPAPGGRSAGTDQPTVVRSESYRPDGTRVETRPVITPSFGNASQLPPPFGTAAPAQVPVAAPAAPFRAGPAPTPAQAQFSTAMAAAPRSAPVRAAPPPAAEPVSAPAGSFYVSLKSAPDEKAIQRDIAGLTDKYKSVLGDVQLATKIADLGSKGVTYRAVAGPLGSRQEAMDLCQKIKGVGGDKACFVTN